MLHILTELSLIFALCLAGEGIAALLPVAFPASVISMLLLMALLLTGVVKERRIQTVSRFLVTNMGLIFHPLLSGDHGICGGPEGPGPALSGRYLSDYAGGLSGGRLDGPAADAAEQKGGRGVMFEAVTSSPFFGLALTLGCWCLGVELQRRTGLLICNPVLVASLLVIGALTVLRVPLECYNAGGGLVKLMLGPATAVLALNIYQQRQVLREHFLPVLAGCLAGSAASMGSVLLLCRLFRAEEMLAASMLPKSVTTAIALGISESGGGIPGITAAAVVITGVEGAMLAPLFARCFRITDPVAEGVAIGASSHAVGTSKALEIGPLQGAMSSIAICVCGIFTSVLALFF